MKNRKTAHIRRRRLVKTNIIKGGDTIFYVNSCRIINAQDKENRQKQKTFFDLIDNAIQTNLISGSKDIRFKIEISIYRNNKDVYNSRPSYHVVKKDQLHDIKDHYFPEKFGLLRKIYTEIGGYNFHNVLRPPPPHISELASKYEKEKENAYNNIDNIYISDDTPYNNIDITISFYFI